MKGFMKRAIIVLSVVCFFMVNTTLTGFALNSRPQQKLMLIESKGNRPSPQPQSNMTVTARSIKPAGALSAGTWTDQSSGTAVILKSVSIVDDQVAWAVGDSGVALRTTNGGTAWQPVTPLIDLVNCVSGVSASVALVCVYHGDGRIYRTTDAGVTWDLVYQNTDPDAYMDAVHMFDANNGVAIGDPVAGQWLFLKTTDGGATWTPQAGPSQDGSEYGWDNSFEWSGTQNGWVGKNNPPVFKTTDGGASWTFSPTKTLNSSSVSFKNSAVGMVADSLFCVSTNGGASWDSVFTYISGPSDIYTHIANVTVPTEQWWETDVSEVIWVSTDRGTSWSNDHVAPLNWYFTHLKMKIVPSANVIVGYAVGYSGGISKYVEPLSPSFSQNSLTVRKLEDSDAQFSSDGDRSQKNWHLEIREGSVGGSVVVSDDADSITASNLFDGTYYAVEADSSGWIHLGYLINGAPTSSGDNNVPVSLSGGQHVTVDFVNAPPAYNQFYRTARYEDWATSADAKGKYKAVKRKNDKVVLKFNIVAPNDANGFILDFGMLVTGQVTEGKDKLVLVGSPFESMKKVTFTGLAINSLDTFQVDGIGSKGKQAKVKVTWTRETKPTTIKQPVTEYKNNDPQLPMPNLHNVGQELFGFDQDAYFPAGLTVGIPQGEKGGQSVIHPKYKDVQKSLVKLVDGTPLLHQDSMHCLDTFPGNHKAIDKQQKSLPPDKYSNKLFAELLTLKLNVAASAMNKFPNGLGELTYDDQTDPTNPFNGQMVDSVILKADSMLSCLPITSKSSVPTDNELYDVLRKINSAFRDSVLDTNSFATKTSFKEIG